MIVPDGDAAEIRPPFTQVFYDVDGDVIIQASSARVMPCKRFLFKLRFADLQSKSAEVAERFRQIGRIKRHMEGLPVIKAEESVETLGHLFAWLYEEDIPHLPSLGTDELLDLHRASSKYMSESLRCAVECALEAHIYRHVSSELALGIYIAASSSCNRSLLESSLGQAAQAVSKIEHAGLLAELSREDKVMLLAKQAEYKQLMDSPRSSPRGSRAGTPVKAIPLHQLSPAGRRACSVSVE